MANNDRDYLRKTLGQIEGVEWTGEKPTAEDSYVLQKSYELYVIKPIEKYTVEDFR